MKSYTIAGLALSFLPFLTVNGQSSYDPPTNQGFEQAIQTLQMQPIRWYCFGTGAGSTITNLTQLAALFNPYGVAAQTVIHQEWERYQPFNAQNFVFTPNSLNLTATIPAGGGLFNGGINSSQIWSKETFKPGLNGKQVYGFLARAKIPNGQGSWPGIWWYSPNGQDGDGSEIDTLEFGIMKWQNQYDWSGFNHGPGVGSDIYSIKSNPWTWHPGIDFSADYHNYEMIWTPDATYKYFDSQLVYAQHFTWTARGAAQFGANLAVGSDQADLPGLQPTSLGQFPESLSIQYITIWAK